jgi:hypothetical protein
MHNQNVNVVRRSVREGISATVDEASLNLMARGAAAGVLGMRDLDRAPARIPDEQRQVILLIGLEGTSYEKAAAILGIPIRTVRSRLSRGRETLRKVLFARQATRSLHRLNGLTLTRAATLTVASETAQTVSRLECRREILDPGINASTKSRNGRPQEGVPLSIFRAFRCSFMLPTFPETDGETSDAQNSGDLPPQFVPFVGRGRFPECLQYDSRRGRRHLGHRERDNRRCQSEQAALLEVGQAELGTGTLNNSPVSSRSRSPTPVVPAFQPPKGARSVANSPKPRFWKAKAQQGRSGLRNLLGVVLVLVALSTAATLAICHLIAATEAVVSVWSS